jgi:hypothetical protein
VAAHFPSPRAGDALKGASPSRWSGGSAASMGSFFNFPDSVHSTSHTSLTHPAVEGAALLDSRGRRRSDTRRDSAESGVSNWSELSVHSVPSKAKHLGSEDEDDEDEEEVEVLTQAPSRSLKVGVQGRSAVKDVGSSGGSGGSGGRKMLKRSGLLAPLELDDAAALMEAFPIEVGHMSYVICRMSYVICHMSYFICHMSYVVCHMSYVICYMSYVICRMSYVICHMSYVVCHMSYVICHMSYVVCHMSYVVCHMS